MKYLVLLKKYFLGKMSREHIFLNAVAGSL